MTFIPRFSLRTLCVFLLLVTSGVGLWWHWEAWYVIGTGPGGPYPLRERFRLDSGPGIHSVAVRDRRAQIRYADGRVARVRVHEDSVDNADPAGDGRAFIVWTHGGQDLIYGRRRPEWWWGVFWLWEFWLTAAFAALFVWSVVRDRRSLRAKEEPTQ